jgi:hypothetical protein
VGDIILDIATEDSRGIHKLSELNAKFFTYVVPNREVVTVGSNGKTVYLFHWVRDPGNYLTLRHGGRERIHNFLDYFDGALELCIIITSYIDVLACKFDMCSRYAMKR